MEEKIYCSHCGAVIDTDDYEELDGQIVCSDCVENHTTVCDCCGERIWSEDAEGDEYTYLCSYCYQNHYTRCSNCDSLIHNDDAYRLDGEDYCRDCYEEERGDYDLIHEYSYKPSPIFYGDDNRYYGIELEIDGAGKNDYYAEELLEIANASDAHIYTKSDGSLDVSITTAVPFFRHGNRHFSNHISKSAESIFELYCIGAIISFPIFAAIIFVL